MGEAGLILILWTYIDAHSIAFHKLKTRMAAISRSSPTTEKFLAGYHKTAQAYFKFRDYLKYKRMQDWCQDSRWKTNIRPYIYSFHHLFCAAEHALKSGRVSDFFGVIQGSEFCSLKYLYRMWVVIIMYHRKHALLDILYLSCSNHSTENCCFNIYMAISSISLFWCHSEDLLKWMR